MCTHLFSLFGIFIIFSGNLAIDAGTFLNNKQLSKARMLKARRNCPRDLGLLFDYKINIKSPMKPHKYLADMSLKDIRGQNYINYFETSSSSSISNQIYIELEDNPLSTSSMVHIEAISNVTDNEFCVNWSNYFYGNLPPSMNLSMRSDNKLMVQLYIIDSAQSYTDFYLQWHHFSNWKGITRVVLLFLNDNDKKLYLYLLPFLMNRNTRLHIILANNKTEIIHHEYQMTSEMFNRLEISVLESNNPLSINSYVYNDFNTIQNQIENQTNLMSTGQFQGYHYEEIPDNNQIKHSIKTIRLFDFDYETINRQFDIKLVGIFKQRKHPFELNSRLTIGVPWDPNILYNADLKSNKCQEYKEPQNSVIYKALNQLLLSENAIDLICVGKIKSKEIDGKEKLRKTKQKYHGFVQLVLKKMKSNKKMTLRLFAAPTTTTTRTTTNYIPTKHFIIYLSGFQTEQDLWIDTTNLYQNVTIFSWVKLKHVYNQSKLVHFINKHSIWNRDYEVMLDIIQQSQSAPIHYHSIDLSNDNHRQFEAEIILDDRRRHTYMSKFDHPNNFQCFSKPTRMIYYNLDMSHWKHSNNDLNVTFYLWKRPDCIFDKPLKSNPNIIQAICDPKNNTHVIVFGRRGNKWMKFIYSLNMKVKCSGMDPYFTGPTIYMSNSSHVKLKNVNFNPKTQEIQFSLISPSQSEQYKLGNCYLTNGLFNGKLWNYYQTDTTYKSSRKLLIRNPNCINRDNTLHRAILRIKDYYLNLNNTSTHVFIPITQSVYSYLKWNLKSDRVPVHLFCSISRCYQDFDSPKYESCQNPINQYLSCPPMGYTTLLQYQSVIIITNNQTNPSSSSSEASKNNTKFNEKYLLTISNSKYRYIIIITLIILISILVILLIGCSLFLFFIKCSSSTLRYNISRSPIHTSTSLSNSCCYSYCCCCCCFLRDGSLTHKSPSQQYNGGDTIITSGCGNAAGGLKTQHEVENDKYLYINTSNTTLSAILGASYIPITKNTRSLTQLSSASPDMEPLLLTTTIGTNFGGATTTTNTSSMTSSKRNQLTNNDNITNHDNTTTTVSPIVSQYNQNLLIDKDIADYNNQNIIRSPPVVVTNNSSMMIPMNELDNNATRNTTSSLSSNNNCSANASSSSSSSFNNQNSNNHPVTNSSSTNTTYRYNNSDTYSGSSPNSGKWRWLIRPFINGIFNTNNTILNNNRHNRQHQLDTSNNRFNKQKD